MMNANVCKRVQVFPLTVLILQQLLCLFITFLVPVFIVSPLSTTNTDNFPDSPRAYIKVTQHAA